MMRRIPLVALVLAGCGHSDATRFWTLDTVAPPATPVAAVVAPVRVDAVHVPAVLDRLEFVTPTGGRRVVVHDFDRWSAPPGEAIRVALTQDLFARLPAGSVVFPRAPKPAGCRALVVDLRDLPPARGGWAAAGAGTVAGTTPRRGQARLSAPGAADPAGETAAVGTLVGQLADRIARSLSEP